MNRRELMAATGAWSAAPATSATPLADGADADVARYAAFGSKLSGGPGDQAAAAWMEARLRALGFVTRRQAFDVPFFDVEAAWLEVGGVRHPIRPQAPWRTTSGAGVAGPLRPWPGGGEVRGAVAVLTLPYRRWSAFRAPEVEPPVRAALAAGAQAVLIVTTGPSGEALLLNVALDAGPVSAPVAALAPADAARIAEALRAGAPARVVVTGAEGRRPAHNLVGALDRGAGRWLVVSTPRSGWDACAGERGGGVAAWLRLAAWAARSAPAFDVLMTSASGHERNYAGAKRFLASGGAPAPERTALWLHLGANVAARDWHELPGRLAPLPSADPQRVLAVSRELLPAARSAFRGLPGLEAPYALDALADGEIGDVVAAGYRRCAGVFGAHRFHHAEGDDLRCTAPGLAEAAAVAFQAFAASVLPASPRS